MTNLLVRKLQGNEISKIEDLDGLENLKAPFPKDNLISKIKGLENLTNLQEFHLEANPIDFNLLESIS